MDDSANKKSPSASPTDSKKEPLSSPTAQPAQSWNFTGDKQKDDLALFTTGNFYDCTFRISNDVANESKVILSALKFKLISNSLTFILTHKTENDFQGRMQLAIWRFVCKKVANKKML